MAQARLLGDLGQDAASLEKSIQLLDQAQMMPDLVPDLKAEALFQKARQSSRMAGVADYEGLCRPKSETICAGADVAA